MVYRRISRNLAWPLVSRWSCNYFLELIGLAGVFDVSFETPGEDGIGNEAAQRLLVPLSSKSSAMPLQARPGGREAARALRDESGLSVVDTARVRGVSRGRIY